MLEMAPLANRFSFFENFKEKEEEKKKHQNVRITNRDVKINLKTGRVGERERSEEGEKENATERMTSWE